MHCSVVHADLQESFEMAPSLLTIRQTTTCWSWLLVKVSGPLSLQYVGVPFDWKCQVSSQMLLALFCGSDQALSV